MRFLIIALTLMAILASTPVMAAQKLESSDDRIKTLVYDPSEVFRIVSRAGFQTSIEFNNDENIDTISIGDSIGWQLTPAGKRLFIKPLHKSGITNLSVITTRRSYQFELVATSSTNLNSSHSYVVKFYYPEQGSFTSAAPTIMPQELSRDNMRPVSATQIPQIPAPYAPPPTPMISAPLPGESGMNPFAGGGMNYAAAPIPMPVQQAPMPPQMASAPAPNFGAIGGGSLNYNYTMSGPDSIAPLKIYDNGRSTYLQMGAAANNPRIAVVGADGNEYQLTPRSENGMVVVDAVAPKISIRQGKDTVYVYNESKSVGR